MARPFRSPSRDLCFALGIWIRQWDRRDFKSQVEQSGSDRKPTVGQTFSQCGLRFHPPHAQRRACLEPACESFNRLVRTLKSVNCPQVRPDPLRSESIGCHRFNDPGMQGTGTPGPGGHFAGFSGALCRGCRCVAGHRPAVDVQFTGDPTAGKTPWRQELEWPVDRTFSGCGRCPHPPASNRAGRRRFTLRKWCTLAPRKVTIGGALWVTADKNGVDYGTDLFSAVDKWTGLLVPADRRQPSPSTVANPRRCARSGSRRRGCRRHQR